MTEDREKIMRRIQKCLRLSKSPEPHEAAVALRQAKALMDRYGISATQAELSDIVESKTGATGKKSVPLWEARLAQSIAQTFGCRVVFEPGRWKGISTPKRGLGVEHDVFESGNLVFIGSGASPEVAAYSFDVLRRQLRKARKDYRDRSVWSDARHLDLFSEGWVHAVNEKVVALRPSDETFVRVDAFMAMRYAGANKAKTRDRSGLGKGQIDASAVRAIQSGILAGQEAQLHSGINRNENDALPWQAP